METIISNEAEETRGLDLENVEEIANSEEIKTDTPSKKTALNQKVLDEYRKEIEDANFIELGNIKRNLKREKTDLQFSKETAESILNLRKELEKQDGLDQLSKQIELANVDQKEKEMFDDIYDFLESYEDSQNALTELIERVDARIHEFDDIPKTTSFMTGLMLETIDKNIKRLETEDRSPEDKKKVMKMLNNQKHIFEHRHSVEFILDKIPNFEIPMRRFVIDCLKPNAARDIIPSTQKQVTKTFTAIFNTNQLSAFEKYLTDLYQDSTDSFFVQYLLYLIYSRELDHGIAYGNHKWIEILIMNVLDITTDNYDLESDVYAYNEGLIQIRDMISKHLINYKKKKK